MPDLSHCLSIVDLQPFFEDACPYPAITEDWRNRYSGRLETIVHPRLGAFFRSLKTEGRLVPIPNSAGYKCRLWMAWHDVVALTDAAPPEDWDAALARLAEQFAHRLVFDITYPYVKLLEAHGAEAALAFDKSGPYLDQVAQFNKGDLPSFTFTSESCWETDLALTISFTNWVPEGCYVGDKGRCLPIPPLEPARVQETVVVLKTGNLLANDWFRIPAFSAAVKGDFPLNSRRGQEAQTRYYAEQFGFVSVGVGNSCAGVFQNGNQLIVGRHDEEEGMPKQLTAHGNICTDLWAATFIEYETLVEIVARALPDTAKVVVDDYLGERTQGSYGLLRLTVEPGTYYLYHFGRHEQFAQMAKAAGIPIEQSIDQPYFILSKERLLPGGPR